MTPGGREQQREDTKARIADAAVRLFASQGFDRTSVRQIAAEARVDPALVLHYHGSKRELFRRLMGDPTRSSGGEVDGIGDDPTEIVLTSLIAKLDDPAGPVMAQLRSMLTNSDARDHARTQLRAVGDALASRLSGDQAAARAQLLLATTLGVAIARELLAVEPLTKLAPDEIAAELRPAVEALVASHALDAD
jgi:AcrR family transcriptional regulator